MIIIIIVTFLHCKKINYKKIIIIYYFPIALIYREIGRRCKGSAGLVWMYAGPKDTAALRETLHT